MGNSRFAIFFEKHIGVGIRWSSFSYQLDLSIAVPFVTINLGLGKEL